MFLERTGLRLCTFGIIDFDMDFLISIIAFEKKSKFKKSKSFITTLHNNHNAKFQVLKSIFKKRPVFKRKYILPNLQNH